jgi:thiol-disulfide isomerase/thioredoxin
MVLDPPLIHAPEFPSSTWINSFEPLTLGALAGRVVVIDFWDFTCANCVRGLPYLREWHARYDDAGATVIGVHTPEFDFARDVSVVKSAVGRLGIRYPVVLDNDQAIWTAYANTCWPTKHLVDAEGSVRGVRQGEGGYGETEAVIQALLRERDPQVVLPELMAPVRPEDVRGAVCVPATPELQVDAAAAELSERRAIDLSLPTDRPEGRVYAEGAWRAIRDGMVLEIGGGSLVVPYHAASVNAVLASSTDPGRSPDPPLRIELHQDERPLPIELYGDDVRLDEGLAKLIVDVPRMYALVRNPDATPHELRLIIDRPGLIFYAFSFGTCLVSEADLASNPTE